MPIKIGLFLSNQFPSEADPTVCLAEVVEQVRRARVNGFSSLWAGQHFLTRPLQSFQSGPMLARLIPEAEGMTFGPNILPLPLLNPVAVAEEAVTMDYLSGGRYILGVGLGYRDEEYEVFNVEKTSRVARFQEAIEVIRRLWSEETVHHTGSYYTLPGVGLGTPPLQPGGPPIWIGASVDPAIKRAAQIGDAWLITFYPSISWLRQQMDLYQSARLEVGKGPAMELPILRECYVGRDAVSAVEEAQKSIAAKYAAYASWGQDKFLPDDEKFNQPFDQFKIDRFIIGDPVFVRDEIQRYYEVLGANHFILRMQWPGLAQDDLLRSIDLLGEKVIPYLG